MRIFHDLDHDFNLVNPVITTGSFDGVHIGHKAIINRINQLAAKIGGESVLITFFPHPRKVLYPESAGKELYLINSQREKVELLRETGLNNLIIINFTKEFSQVTSIEFIRSILVQKLRARKIVIGFNHHFGFNREGNFEYLEELGKYYNFEVEEIPEQDIHNETVSSTLIRKALQEGRIQRANAYLDHHYLMIGRLVENRQLFPGSGMVTYHLGVEEQCKLVPPDGVYAVRVDDKSRSFKAILNIKNSRYGPERHFEELVVEIFPAEEVDILDGMEVTVTFAKRMRDELDFSSAIQLMAQLALDREEAMELIY